MKTKSSLDVLYNEHITSAQDDRTKQTKNGQNMRVAVIADQLSLKWKRFLLFLYVSMHLTSPFQYLFIKLKTPLTASLY